MALLFQERMIAEPLHGFEKARTRSSLWKMLYEKQASRKAGFA
jgi:hypothetical protein